MHIPEDSYSIGILFAAQTCIINLNDIITCPKGFGLKLAKLGLKTPLKK